MKKRPKLVYLEWVDSTGHGQRWKYESDLSNRPGLVTTVGFVVKEDKRCITVASAIGDHSLSVPEHEFEYGGIHTIVKACIYRRVDLGDPRLRKGPKR